MKNMILKTGFLASLVLVLALGVIIASQPASAKVLGPISNCPTYACPSNLSGWTSNGTCTTNYGHGCVEECSVFRQTSNGQLCKQTTNCNWW